MAVLSLSRLPWDTRNQVSPKREGYILAVHPSNWDQARDSYLHKKWPTNTSVGRLCVRAITRDSDDLQYYSQSPVARCFLSTAVVAALTFSSVWGPHMAFARPEGVNRPELLPEQFTPLIDVAGFLSPQQEVRIIKELISLEDETGYKLRVLAQNYPNTPGLAVKSFWEVDDNTVVFVADPNMGNILNFNVGVLVDVNVPRSFWSRLAGKYGNIFYWREKGEDASIEAAVAAIGTCLREPAGPRACANIQ